MKILVTGGAGFIGSHVVDAMVAAEHDVVVLDNLSRGKTANINPRARLIEADITDPAVSEVFAEERFDVVNHHAAQVSIGFSVREPLHDAAVNILGSINILEAVVASRVKKFIYISSGGAMYGEPKKLPMTEDHPVQPSSPYGVSKHTVEHYLHFYQQTHGLQFTSLRYPNVYGPRQDPDGEAGVVTIFIKQMIGNDRVIINGTGEQVRDFLYVSDCVTANLLALEKGDGGMYNLGWGTGISVNQLFEHLCRLTSYHQAPSYGPAKPGEVFRSFVDSRKAQQELGWYPRVPLEQGLQKTVVSFDSVMNFIERQEQEFDLMEAIEKGGGHSVGQQFRGIGSRRILQQPPAPVVLRPVVST